MDRANGVSTGRAIGEIVILLCVFSVLGFLVRPIFGSSESKPGCVCQSNLKVLSQAFMMYINDYDGTLPSSYAYGHSTTWNADDYTRFATEQGTLPPLSMTGQLSWPELLSPYLSSHWDYDRLWCPSDHSRSDRPEARVSYYYKAALDRACYGSPYLSPLKEGDFRFWSNQMVFYEHTVRHYGRPNLGLADGALINCVFFDGHAAAVEIRDSGYARGDDTSAPLPPSGVGEPAWFNYSMGSPNPGFSRGQNWNPRVWADRLREEPPECDDPAVMCQQNLKRLAMAMLMYVNDYDAKLPSSYLYGRSQTWNPSDFAAYASERGTLPPPQGGQRLTWPMMVYPYIRSDRYFWCPSDDARSDEPSASVSYYWKAAVDAAWYGGPDGSGPRAWREGDFAFPAEQIVLFERSPWHGQRKNSGLCDGAVINCAYLDGHVGVIEIRDSGYTRREIPAGPLPASGVGEPAWFNYSFGSGSPEFSKGQNWDPSIWGDNLP